MRSTPSGPPKLDMTCPACGHPIDVTEGGWREGEALLHTGCVDWAKRPFPFDWELDRLRRLSRLLRRTVRAVDDAGVWWLSFVSINPAPPGDDVQWESHWATLTFYTP